MDIAEKVQALKDWLSNRTGAEVDTGFEFRRDTYWFRIQVRDVQTSPMLWVANDAFGDHSVEDIWKDLEDLEVLEMLVADPAHNLLYTRMREVEEYNP